MTTCMLSRVTDHLRVGVLRPGRPGAVGLVLGLAVDAVIGDPRRGHPVAAFGRSAGALQSRLERDNRVAGGLFWLATVGGVIGTAGLLTRIARSSAVVTVLLTAWSTWAVVGGTTLGREADRIADAVAAGDLSLARELLPNLCGRDPSDLDGTALLRATIESVAENTGDAVVSPLLWGAVAGPAGLLGFRALNTLDAMVGHHSERYERFGWASARLDDIAGLLPARIGSLATVGLAPVVDGRPGVSWRAWRRDAPAHPSPNAGPLEAAFAGALGLRLGGPVHYAYGVSDRPWLHPSGRDPVAGDIRRVVRLSRAVSAATACIAVGWLWRGSP